MIQSNYQLPETQIDSPNIDFTSFPTEISITYKSNFVFNAGTKMDIEKFKSFFEVKEYGINITNSIEVTNWDFDTTFSKTIYVNIKFTGLTGNQIIKVLPISIINTAPRIIGPSNKIFTSKNEITEEMMLVGYQAIDFEDGDITSKMYVDRINISGLSGNYEISIKDSSNKKVTKIVEFEIRSE